MERIRHPRGEPRHHVRTQGEPRGRHVARTEKHAARLPQADLQTEEVRLAGLVELIHVVPRHQLGERVGQRVAEIACDVSRPPLRITGDDRPQKMRAPAARRAEEVYDGLSKPASHKFAQSLQRFRVAARDKVVQVRFGAEGKVENELLHNGR